MFQLIYFSLIIRFLYISQNAHIFINIYTLL